jgi:predicted N-formylglutamate amidohydrolase
MNKTRYSLLATDEPSPVTVYNAAGSSPFLIVVDHASNAIPRSLRGLGIPEIECQRHIALDIGVAMVSRLVAAALDATVIQQNYSRLVIDCNRKPGTETSIPVSSELTSIPGNIDLNETEKSARVREVFEPYHNRIAAELDLLRQAGRPAVLIAMHSFTPEFMGVARPWHCGMLYNRDPRFAHVLLALLKREDGVCVGDNEPYSVTDAMDYTIPVHGERRGLLHVEIEIRQDLINDDGGQRIWAARLARLLLEAYQTLAVSAVAINPSDREPS